MDDFRDPGILNPFGTYRMEHDEPCSTLFCDVCDASIDGEPAGRGLLVFPRGDAPSYEEPPLCHLCAHAIGITALWRWAEEEDGG